MTDPLVLDKSNIKYTKPNHILVGDEEYYRVYGVLKVECSKSIKEARIHKLQWNKNWWIPKWAAVLLLYNKFSHTELIRTLRALNSCKQDRLAFLTVVKLSNAVSSSYYNFLSSYHKDLKNEQD